MAGSTITRKPAGVFPPSDFIRDELAARGWTQADLANVVGKRRLQGILNSKRGITADSAKKLAVAFGTKLPTLDESRLSISPELQNLRIRWSKNTTRPIPVHQNLKVSSQSLVRVIRELDLTV
jgi:HTH-type transcriptional regulator/antitoxin HigA